MSIIASASINTNAAFTMSVQNSVSGQSPVPDTAIDHAAAVGATLSLKTRFGEVMVDVSKSIIFPRGLLGIPDKQRYAVTRFPSAKMAQFKMLQSLDDHQLSFITLPLDIENSIISSADIKAVAADMQIALEDLAVLLIVSVHRSPDQVRLSANARAPLFMDAKRKIGVQHVFQNENYKVQHMFS